MNVWYRENRSPVSWAVTLTDVLLLVGVAVACQSTRMLVYPSTRLLVYVVSYLIVTLWLPPIVVRPMVRCDEIMRRCVQKVLLTALLFAALTGTRLLVYPSTRLLAYSSAALTAWWWVWRQVIVGAGWTDEGVLAPEAPPMSYALNCILKRGLDIVLSLAFLLTLFPIIYGVVFGVSKARKAGRIYTTRGGLVEFRTVCGRWARLPHFFNVLRGDISLVGNPAIITVTDAWYTAHWTIWTDISLIIKAICSGKRRKNPCA